MRSRSCTVVSLALTLTAAACGGGDDLPPLTDATSLSCPDSGPLPFRLMTSKFANKASDDQLVSQPRNKDESSDALGNPGGLQANVYIDDAAAPAAGDIDYHGRKALTEPNNGASGTGVPGEAVSLWTYDPGAKAWKMLDRTMTDDSGYYDFPANSFVAANGEPVYAMLEGDGSCAKHYDYLLPPGSKVVVTDIDGTLTSADSELITELGDETYVPKMKARPTR